MPDANDFKTIHVQASLFTPGLHFQGMKVLAYFLANHKEDFSGQPVSLPIPDGAPLDVPHVLLRSEDSFLNLQVSPARINVFKAGDNLTSGEVSDFLVFATNVFVGYVEAMGARAGRVACVLQRLAPHEDPAKTIATHFCREKWLGDPLQRTSDFELHAAKMFNLGGQEMVNSWFRCKSGRLRKGDHSGIPIIFVEQDFNTLAEEAEARSFSPGQLQQFYNLCPGEFQVVLERYFPVEGRRNV